MNILSLFDGMSCGQIALERAGIKVDNYFASEIDKYAIKVAMPNYPNTNQIGSVVNVNLKSLPKIDLLIGGSPCQGFSFAGKGLNFNDERSKLFFEYVRIWNEIKAINPNALFLLENVQMKYEHELVISRYMNVNPIVINSTLVSAQNRVRNYWTNINNKPVGMFGDMQPDIQQPKDKGILLKHILEKEVEDKYFVKNIGKLLRLKSNIKDGNKKAACFTAGGNSGGNHSDMDLIKVNTVIDLSHRNEGIRYYEEKAPILNARDYKEPRCVAVRGKGDNNEQQLEQNNSGKTNSITTVQKDNLIMQLNPSKESNGCQPYQQNRVYGVNGKSPAHLAELSCNSHAILDNYYSFTEDKHYLSEGMKVRRLTEVECERLQTVPDNYTNHVSSTQRYKMLGNGWTVDVIAHIFKHIQEEI